MELPPITLLGVILHLDVYLDAFVLQYGVLIYGMLFLIVFCETGLVVAPFLPGDSLLFVAGAIAGGGGLSTPILLMVLLAAAILGDTANYTIGKLAGEKLLVRFPNVIKPKHLERTYHFFERHGSKTIILCRFVPVVRTLGPFVAGAGAMSYGRFMRSNIAGGVLWVAVFVFAGYFFGKTRFVEEHFSLVLLGVIAFSCMPAIVELVRGRYQRKSAESPSGHI